MAYVDRQSGSRRAASIATVALIHAGIGVVLIVGLAAKFVPQEDDGPLETTEFALPEPSPSVEPTEKTEATESTVTTVRDPFDFPTPIPTEFPTQATTENTGVDVNPTPTPTIPAREDPPKDLFPVKHPRPTGDQSRWVTADDYPSSDLRAGHTGTTGYRVVVGTNGRVSSCEVVRSSGWPGLDKAACAKVKSNARFQPGTDGTGAKTVDTYSGAVVWRIPQ